jgi:serine/threonine protein kinase
MMATSLSHGTRLGGRFVIGEEIGRGGYSVVYLAQDTLLGSDVAIKLLCPPPALAHTARERMRREVQAARGLSHQHIVTVHDLLEADDATCVVMEYVPGMDLARRVEASGPLTPEQVARLGREVASALTAAHSEGVLHRDVKPQNILIDHEGAAKLADFGSAKLDGQASMTQTGGVVGTLAFLPPEVLDGGRPDGRSDLYALGLTLYFALVGDLPPHPSRHLPPEPRTEGFSPGALRADVPAWLDALVCQATSADPMRRPATPEDFAQALSEEAWPRSSRDDDIPGTCYLCDGVDPLSMGICHACVGAESGPADHLLFLEQKSSHDERDRVARLLRKSVPREAIPWVLHGSRAIARLPRDAARRVRSRMDRQGVPLRMVRGILAWAPMPVSFYLVVCGVAVTGAWAGLPLTTVSLPLAVALLLLGQLGLQRPLFKVSARRDVLPPNAFPEVVSALGELPAGPARDLLAQIVYSARDVYQQWRRLGDKEAIEKLSGILQASCVAATEVASLDAYLTNPRMPQAAAPQLHGMDQGSRAIEHARDTLVQQLLETVSAMGDLRAGHARLTSADTALPALTDGLRERALLHDEARAELDAFLEGSQDPALVVVRP